MGVVMGDRIEFTSQGLILFLTNFYDLVLEKQEELSDYRDLIGLARDFVVDEFQSCGTGAKSEMERIRACARLCCADRRDQGICRFSRDCHCCCCFKIVHGELNAEAFKSMISKVEKEGALC